MIKRIQNKIAELYKANINKSRIIYSKIVPSMSIIAHHGLQRNGTNYLMECLYTHGLAVANSYRDRRNLCSYKHYRFYEHKELIPKFLKQKSIHKSIKNIDDINKIAGYPPKTKHIIIKKQQQDSIVSMMNYGLSYGWFENKQEALQSYRVLLDDYIHYVDFWQRLESINETRVSVLSFEHLIEDESEFYKTLDKLGIKYSKIKSLKFDRINMSPKERLKQIFKEDLQNENKK
jgi:hypothetical protein